ncbi:MAG: peptidoglycan-binding domain-containing protein [Ferruginibacter sp.]
MVESACIDSGISMPDSSQLSKAIKKYQLKHGLVVDGKYGKNVVNSLNSNDIEKFKRIAVTMDKYKQLPEKCPTLIYGLIVLRYYLRVINDDTLVLNRK